MTTNYRAEWTFKHPLRQGLRLHVVVTDRNGGDQIELHKSIWLGLLGRRLVSRINCPSLVTNRTPALAAAGAPPSTSDGATLAHGVYLELIENGWEIAGFDQSVRGRSLAGRLMSIEPELIVKSRPGIPDPLLVKALVPYRNSSVEYAPSDLRWLLSRN